ncbi:MAG: alpha-hydroxy acid oxidase [Pseudomonadota bacterium]
MRLADVVSSEDMRRLAQLRLPRSVFEFVDGGAEDEQTLAENRAAFQRSHFKPRVLRDVSEPEIKTKLWGESFSAPIVIAPMGSCKLVWPDADIVLAQAAAARGIPYTLSTMSGTSIEDMARSVDGPLWFQLYVLKDMEFNLKLLDRARASDYSALAVTVDLPAGGKRERDLRNGVSIPLRLTARQIFEGVTHPGWSLRLLRGGLPQFENVRGLLGDMSAGMTIAARVGANLHAGFDWEDFARIRDHWPGKLLVKGVMHPEDARQLVAAGADGLWVSNHGGRQLDGAMGTYDALQPVADAVGNKVPVILDSGIRRGQDILKARARGASAVAVGRVPLFGAAAGPDGVDKALAILTEELRLTMKLAGTPTFADVDASLLA